MASLIVAQIGLGYWGNNHLNVWRELKHQGVISDIVVFDKDPEKLKAACKLCGADVAGSLENALKLPALVDIVTPPSANLKILSHVANKSAVLIEKPLATLSEDAGKIKTVAKEYELRIMVGHIFRYHAGINLLRDKIKRGDFGQIYNIDVRRAGYRVPRQDMDILSALAIHDVDLFCYLLGKNMPAWIDATAKANVFNEVCDVATVQAGFQRGALDEVLCTGYYSWLCPRKKERTLIIYGERQSAEVDLNDPTKVIVYDAGIATKNGIPVAENEGHHTVPIADAEPPLTAELKAFIRFAEGNTTDNTPTLEVGMRAVELIDIAKQSALEGRRLFFGTC